VDVGLDEAGGQQSAVRVDRLAPRPGAEADVNDAAIGDRDVDRVGASREPAAPDEEI
jgi:hypothetical protein